MTKKRGSDFLRDRHKYVAAKKLLVIYIMFLNEPWAATIGGLLILCKAPTILAAVMRKKRVSWETANC